MEKEIEKYQFKPTWSDECDVLENFKPMDFSTTDGLKAPKVMVVPIKDVPAEVTTSTVKKSDRKRRVKINNLFCDFCEKKNHVAADCFLLKAYNIHKACVIKNSSKCTICNKTNHLTHECAYLKNYEQKVNEIKAKALEREGSSSAGNKSKQRFESVETSVTKALNKTSVPREVQVTDAPPSNLFLKGHGQPTYKRVPHVYEVSKKPSKQRVNRHPHGYNHLIGNGQEQMLQEHDQSTDHCPRLEK